MQQFPWERDSGKIYKHREKTQKNHYKIFQQNIAIQWILTNYQNELCPYEENTSDMRWNRGWAQWSSRGPSLRELMMASRGCISQVVSSYAHFTILPPKQIPSSFLKYGCCNILQFVLQPPVKFVPPIWLAWPKIQWTGYLFVNIHVRICVAIILKGNFYRSVYYLGSILIRILSRNYIHSYTPFLSVGYYSSPVTHSRNQNEVALLLRGPN